MNENNAITLLECLEHNIKIIKDNRPLKIKMFHVAKKEMNWENACEYAKNFNIIGNDWRLATPREIIWLIENNGKDEFYSTGNYWGLWSSDFFGNDAVRVRIDDGATLLFPKKFNYGVVCVR